MKNWPIAYVEAWGQRAEDILPGKTGRARAAQALTRLLARASIPPSTQEVRGHIEFLRTAISPRAVYDQIRWLRDAFTVVDSGEYDEVLTIAFVDQSNRVHGPKRPKRLRQYTYTKGLPGMEWPTQARTLWERAVHGPLTELAPRYRRSLATAYARWLRWRRDVGLEWAPADEVAVEYWIKSNANDPDISPLYRASLIMRLWTVERAFHLVQETTVLSAADFIGLPGERATEGNIWEMETDLVDQDSCIDWFGGAVAAEDEGAPLRWLLDRGLALRAGARGTRRRRYPRIELPDLIHGGETLMAEAQSMRLGRAAATLFRNGLLLMMLGRRCVRLANVHALSLIEEPGCGWIDLSKVPGRMCWPAALCKNRSTWQTELPAEVRPYIDAYLARYRPVLLRGQGHACFWVSGENGSSLSYAQIEVAFKSAAKRAFGHALPPHQVRHINAVYVTETIPDKMWLVSAVLGHADPRSRRHYDIMARQRLAQRKALSIVEAQAAPARRHKQG